MFIIKTTVTIRSNDKLKNEYFFFREKKKDLEFYLLEVFYQTIDSLYYILFHHHVKNSNQLMFDYLFYLILDNYHQDIIQVNYHLFSETKNK
jgi:hypothetical protein